MLTSRDSFSDTEQATYFIVEWIFRTYRMGTPLPNIMVDCAKYAKQSEDLGKPQPAMLANFIGQCCANLMGTDNQENPSCNSGSILTESKRKLYSELNVGTYEGLEEIRFMSMRTYLGLHVENANRILEFGLGKYEQLWFGSNHAVWTNFTAAVSFFAAFQETQERKYIKAALKLSKQLKKLQKQNYSNVRDYVNFLDAEVEASTKRKEPATRRLYEQVISQNARNGRIHDAGLASERMGDYYKIVMKDTNEAKYRYEQAIKFYEEWGAKATVRLIRTKHRDLWPNEGQS